MSSILRKLKELGNIKSENEKEKILNNLWQTASQQTFYEIMGVDVSKPIDTSQLKKTYHSMAVILHPDKNAGKGYQSVASKLFALAKDAYETLTDTEKERQYKISLRPKQETTPPTHTYQPSASYANSSPNDTYSNPYNIFEDPLFHFTESMPGFYPRPHFSPFSNTNYPFNPETVNDFFQDTVFGSSPSFRFVFYSTGFPDTPPTNRARPSRQEPREIKNFEQFLDLYDYDKEVAYGLFKTQTKEAINLCQSAEQFLALHDKDKKLAHEFYNYAPYQIISLFQTSEQLIRLDNKCQNLTYQFYNLQPERVISLFQTDKQFLRLLDSDRRLAIELYQRQPIHFISLFQSFEKYMVLVKADASLANDFIRLQPAFVIGLIKTGDQYTQLYVQNEEIALNVLRIKPNLLDRFKPQENTQRNPRGDSGYHRQPSAPNFFSQPRQTPPENNTQQNQPSHSTFWDMMNNIKEHVVESVGVLIGTVALIGLMRLTQRNNGSSNSHSSSPRP